MDCPLCGSDRTNPLTLSLTVLECQQCNHRFHVHGFRVEEVEARVSHKSLLIVGAGVPLPIRSWHDGGDVL